VLWFVLRKERKLPFSLDFLFGAASIYSLPQRQPDKSSAAMVDWLVRRKRKKKASCDLVSLIVVEMWLLSVYGFSFFSSECLPMPSLRLFTWAQIFRSLAAGAKEKIMWKLGVIKQILFLRLNHISNSYNLVSRCVVIFYHTFRTETYTIYNMFLHEILSYTLD